jgi:hypothetical protein
MDKRYKITLAIKITFKERINTTQLTSLIKEAFIDIVPLRGIFKEALNS